MIRDFKEKVWWKELLCGVSLGYFVLPVVIVLAWMLWKWSRLEKDEEVLRGIAK
ncbi:hypothetical protein [endosymbiont GvMRE of Glomus versiforme]|uniref:hypothetical protein n=1 Tax=endosymbiont GvMRE of Glomus versiforme TaxID=2039283 RepID=UPI001558BE90|nr:hypothetical protein [endosymbiont GvMRE of Glomus versiforme]